MAGLSTKVRYQITNQIPKQCNDELKARWSCKMSKGTIAKVSNSLQDVRVDILPHRSRRHTQGEMQIANTHRGIPKVSTRSIQSEVYDKRGPNLSSDFVYVNTAYVGSVDSVNVVRLEPPTSVVREQYWACSKWPFAQRVLAIAVGVLVGAVIGLALSMGLRGGEPDLIQGIFRSHSPPD